MNSNAVSIKMEGESPIVLPEHGQSSPPSSNPATGIDWRHQGPTAQASELAPSAHIRLARSVRGTERQRVQSEHGHSLHGSDPFPSYYRPHTTTVSTSSAKPKRIPRPPNAFILYRSDLIAQKFPEGNGASRRQQTLSCVAGECWNLLPPEEKKRWQDQAAELAARHQLEYPEYHFKPSRRGNGKPKLRVNDDKNADTIRNLRETYTGIKGPSICSSRQKKLKNQGKEAHRDTVELVPSLSSMPAAPAPFDPQVLGGFDWAASYQLDGQQSHPSTPAATPSWSPFDMQGPAAYNCASLPPSGSPTPSLPSPGSVSSNAPLPPFFPQSTFPHITPPRRPSTSLGFVRRMNEDFPCSQAGHDLERPASAASDTGLTSLVRDLSIQTSTAAELGHIAMPDMYGMSSSADAPGGIVAPFPFPAANGPFPAFASGGMEELSTPFGETQFPMTLDEAYAVPNFFNDWAFEDMNSLGAGDGN